MYSLFKYFQCSSVQVCEAGKSSFRPGATLNIGRSVLNTVETFNQGSLAPAPAPSAVDEPPKDRARESSRLAQQGHPIDLAWGMAIVAFQLREGVIWSYSMAYYYIGVTEIWRCFPRPP